jgi:hypothetical protein
VQIETSAMHHVYCYETIVLSDQYKKGFLFVPVFGGFRGMIASVNDRVSRCREFLASGELFLPGPSPFSIIAGNY